ncbi:hypothetical protein BV22DRAFT_1052429 [Leucogyrophana mollusca]|uniref:Uncharacterized protein n=1 Tax=Leucogyrophana mollusca TaxID=85980 RepID=A0ACB8AVM4_9AGAM|nr:hypothetical protein BV22DRAFT_1052429 [Leucogyrophana mollusca]
MTPERRNDSELMGFDNPLIYASSPTRNIILINQPDITERGCLPGPPNVSFNYIGRWGWLGVVYKAHRTSAPIIWAAEAEPPRLPGHNNVKKHSPFLVAHKVIGVSQGESNVGADYIVCWRCESRPGFQGFRVTTTSQRTHRFRRVARPSRLPGHNNPKKGSP